MKRTAGSTAPPRVMRRYQTRWHAVSHGRIDGQVGDVHGPALESPDLHLWWAVGDLNA